MSKPPTVLKTTKPSAGHLKHVAKQSGVSVEQLRQMVRNFNSYKLSDFPIHKEEPNNQPKYDKQHFNRINKLKLGEDVPANAMGASDSTHGPIATFDPLLEIGKRKRRTNVMRRFKQILKKN